ncbi:TolC family protein [Thalassolituus sp. UBA3500]|uniref:TolC family protein n=1 Tax=Thalassolituus sp. UBA3500 TaxID=1947664 RepID=UPI000C107086|nr:TolC family protein [Thalassolituus sp. UBA3500]MBN57932.1 transporter [Oceanospirillaceae bacterium]|tara:strand:- start:64 stop:1392 length:1329 start_codon:yes stop_codon:yes gene_type:complete
MSLKLSSARWLGLVALTLSGQVFSAELTLNQAIEQALEQDLWQTSSARREQALIDRAESSGSLPDPSVTLTAGNFPVDTFDIQQEPMTQLSVAVTQMFPRGDSRALSAQKNRELSSQQPLLRQDRSLKVEQAVTRLWLQGYEAQESIKLMEQERDLLRQLVDAARAGYASGLNNTRQQDVVEANVELIRLEDRLAELRQALAVTRQQLGEWLSESGEVFESGQFVGLSKGPTPDQLPTAETVIQHPQVLAFERRIQSSETGEALARQSYRPAWGLTAKYGYRDDDLMGNNRADLMSVGVTFDLPLFTGNRQDREVSAAVADTEALRTDKTLLLRRMRSELSAAMTEYAYLYERKTFYQQQLLPQVQEQASAALSAYHSDRGDFPSVVKVRTSVLNTRLARLKIETSLHRTLADIRYLSATALSSTESPTSGSSSSGELKNEK